MDHAIEAEDSRSDAGDSGYSDTLVSTESLRTSVYAYEEENGRTYHAYHAGKYHVPNDAGEQERMDLHYHAMRLSIGDRLFHAPVTTLDGVLDVGCGTGIWCMDMGDEYPAASVIGFDLSPIQPSFVPPNVQFEVADADEDWTYGHNRFDLVHTRFMNGFSVRSWPHLYQQAMESLRPGGWIENQELDVQVLSDDNTMPEDSKVQEWVRLWNEGMGVVGMTGRCDPEVLAQQMREAGFINVHVKRYKMPIGPWPKDPALKEAGVYGLVAILDGMQGLSIKIFTNCLGWSVEQLEVFLAEVRKEWKRRGMHTYWPCFVIMGQKPPAS
ncbi:S-adenosyl-L-methionine-dependent methyltransferase [Exophiala viscosa]|uniref:S-adenosyl-L-methionine-dependent methyltransferase n=1 Tax=Exophiala viscosa TaxID=2486360 RepID=A0AAN6DXY3_9EURO|nr:S-adenosyl-L-methionine-dependent methyltransferase [Exophiala viscosa]KAI1625989.1 S-adenosyl-L-methionine-dependent methyltransferase [Exophiala viscosa]